jgi:hypothetical protein
MIRSDEPVGRRVKQFDQRTTRLDQCLHSAGAARALGGSPGLNEPTPYAGRSSRRRSRRPFINIKFHRTLRANDHETSESEEFSLGA